MATDIQEALLYVQQNVSELRKLGKEWGLNQTEINHCVKRALSMKIAKPPASKTDKKLQTTKFKARKTWSKCRCCLGLCLGLMGVLALVTTFTCGVLMYKANSIYPGRFLQPYGYYILRTIRLVGVPLHNPFRIEKYYHKECILDNPLFTELPPDCDLCKTYKSVKELKMKVPTVKIPLLSYPLMHRGIQTPVRLEDVRELISTHRANLQGEYIISTAKWARFASDLARDDLLEQITQEDKFSCEWDSKERMFLSQIMRRLFPRPSVLPTEMEVALQKHIIIDGKGSKPRILPTSMMGGYCWYAQGTGTRIIVFKPFKQCEDTCKSFQITVKEGDILTYPSDRWLVEATENGDDISVAFVGFMMP